MIKDKYNDLFGGLSNSFVYFRKYIEGMSDRWHVLVVFDTCGYIQ